MFELLQCADIGMGLTDSMAMTPAASVSGFFLSHPDSVYFNVGRVGDDQVADLARRRSRTEADVRRLIGSNL
jgi:5-methyltetrahydrofolate--homocysteine methyltransferase